MNIRKVRNAAARGRKVGNVKPVSLEHRKGSAAAKAEPIFTKMFRPYLKGEVKRGEIVAKAAKAAKISPATASTYFHQFAAAQD